MRSPARCRRASLVVVLVVSMAASATACGGDDASESRPRPVASAPNDDVTDAADRSPEDTLWASGSPPANDDRERPAVDSSGDKSVEDAQPISIELNLPEQAPFGTGRIPLTIETDSEGWDSAQLVVDTTGDVTVEGAPALDDLVPHESWAGVLQLAVPPGDDGDPTESTVTIIVQLSMGGTVSESSGTRVAIISDATSMWMGLGGHGQLLRVRLVALLEAGEIGQAEFDEAFDATFASDEATGTATRVDQTND